MKHKKPEKSVNLGLQGGGSHGAFTWGVLDRILEDGRITIDGICATSAGAMNACVLAYGMQQGGAEKAREDLHDFWWKIHKEGTKYKFPTQMPWQKMLSWNMDNDISYFMLDSMSRMFSPYQLNPMDINPLRDILEETIDFEVLRNCDCVKLFISATNVRTGKVKVFNTDEITRDVVMASACLPLMFKAVEIEGEHYWDGGYMGNPALFPLFYKTDSRDVIIVHVNPVACPDVPTTAQDIMNRVNEISFNSSLLKEMRAIAFVKKLVEHDMLKDEHKNDFKDILVHSIRADDALGDLGAASKFDLDWDFLTGLRDKGRATTDAWLDAHYDDLGVRDSVDLHTEFLSSTTKIFEDKDSHRRHKTQKIGT